MVVMKAKPMPKLERPKDRGRMYVFEFVTHECFDRVIYVCILLNTFILSVKYYDEPERVSAITDWLNYFFATVFLFEAVLKLIALGKVYFQDGWNNFDLFIVMGTLLGWGITLATNIDIGSQASILRAFRIGRMFKLMKRNKSLRIIFDTFLLTLPALANLGGLLLLFLYIYAVLGEELFAKVKFSGPLGEHINFHNIFASMQTLFRVATGERWHEVMHAVTR